MTFSPGQLHAVREVFSLAGFEGELRTLPVEAEHERVFVVPTERLASMGDAHSLEIVLCQLLDRPVLVTEDLGAPTVAFE